MNIVWLTSEAYPYAKTGGLADVSHSFCKTLSEKGHKVSVIMPYYPQIMKGLCSCLNERYKMLGVTLGFHEEWAKILEHKVSDNLSFYFIEFSRYFDRPFIYAWDSVEFSDNAERFIFFSRVAMQAILALKLKPDIIHTNDWHAALCNVYLKSHLYSGFEDFSACKSVLTIHNVGYQGVFNKSNMYWTGLGWGYFNYTCLEYFDQINLLKAGIMTADMVTTVSRTYASEILTSGYAFTMESALNHVNRQGKLKGILNGIDIHVWNPETDHFIPSNYSRKDFSGKKLCKEGLQNEFGLADRERTPLFGVISRLTAQKGIDVLTGALWDVLQKDDVQFVFLGAGEPWLHRRLDELAANFPGKIGVYIGYNDRLAHLIEAGSDIIVMPSRYEPCGLNQMYSMRYGTVPVVRATGGLVDTVDNFNPEKPELSTGFKFYDLSLPALQSTLRWAADTYRTKPELFKRMALNGMSRDFSWEHTVSLYEELYRRLLNRIPQKDTRQRKVNENKIGEIIV